MNAQVDAAKAAEDAAEVAQLRQRLEQVVHRSQNIKALIKARLKAKRISVEDDPDDDLTLVYHAGEDKLTFAFGGETLDEEGQHFLRWYIPTVLGVISSDDIRPNVESILIQGHTDSVGTEEVNLELSQKRAFNVLLYSLNECDLDGNEEELLLKLTSISGRGMHDLLPRGAEEGSEDADRSRRVEFKIRVKSNIGEFCDIGVIEDSSCQPDNPSKSSERNDP